MTAKTQPRTQKQILASIASLAGSFAKQKERAQELAIESVEFFAREGNTACVTAFYAVMGAFPVVRERSVKPWFEDVAGVAFKSDGTAYQRKGRSWKNLDMAEVRNAVSIWSFARPKELPDYDGLAKVLTILQKESENKVNADKYGECELIDPKVREAILSMVRDAMREREIAAEAAAAEAEDTIQPSASTIQPRPTHQPASVSVA